MAKSVTACKDAFSICRKEEDTVAGVIQSCSVNTDGLKSKLKSLTTNTNAVTEAKKKVDAIIASRKLVLRDTAKTCAEIISKAAELIKRIGEAAASPKVAVLAKEISDSTATCTAAEKQSLKSTSTSLSSAIVSIAAETAAAQETLLCKLLLLLKKIYSYLYSIKYQSSFFQWSQEQLLQQLLLMLHHPVLLTAVHQLHYLQQLLHLPPPHLLQQQLLRRLPLEEGGDRLLKISSRVNFFKPSMEESGLRVMNNGTIILYFFTLINLADVFI